jgi:transposase
VFLDETGAKTNLTRLYARARRGQRQIDHAPAGHWNTTTLVAAITCEAPIAPMMLDGAMDSLAFVAYVEQVLVPAMPKGAIVVMDNLGAHQSPAIERLLAQAGAELRYLPPYSPDFNPIELMWSKIKAALRAAKARTKEELWAAIAHALTMVTPADLRAFFCHCFVGMIT